jgi:hypothetical protein
MRHLSTTPRMPSRQARLDKIAEVRRQLDEELANLHQALGEKERPHDPQCEPRCGQWHEQENEQRDNARTPVVQALRPYTTVSRAHA